MDGPFVLLLQETPQTDGGQAGEAMMVLGTCSGKQGTECVPPT